MFKITYYCSCEICSEEWGTKTSTGKQAIEGQTIAVDPNVIPYGSKVKIGDNIYIAEDCGGGVMGNHIDIYVNSHSETVKNGVKFKSIKVYSKEEN